MDMQPSPGVSEKSVIKSGNSFGFKLLSQVNSFEQNENASISPFSISMVFGMLLNGSGGATLDSLKKSAWLYRCFSG